MHSQRLPFSELPVDLARRGYKPLKYRTLYNLALDGKVPVTRHNGRLYIEDPDTTVPEIAERLGLMPERVAA